MVSDVIASAYESAFRLRIPEWRVMAVLGEDGASSQQALCAATCMDKMTVSRAVAALRVRRLVSAGAQPGDRRAKTLALTSAGHALYTQVVPRALELESRLLVGFSKAERASLEALLARIDVAATSLSS